MSIFRLVALISPIVVGFIIPFLIAITVNRVNRHRTAIIRCVLFLLILFAILYVLSIVCGEYAVTFAKLAVFLSAFAVLIFSLFYLLSALRLPSLISQVVIYLVVILMVGTIFWFNPIIENAESSGLSSEDITDRANLALALNPYVVVGSILNMDVMRFNILYSSSLIAKYNFRYTSWTTVAIWYMVFSATVFVLYLLSFLLFRAKRKYGK